MNRRLAVLAVTVLACSDSPSGNSNPCPNTPMGPFTGSASGFVTGSLAGCASYGVTSSGGSPVLGLALSSGSPTNPSLILSLARAGSRPAAGTYDIGATAGEFAGSVFLNFQNQTFALTSGTVTIDVSSADGIGGTLGGSVNVTGTATGSGGSITVTGNFSAKCTSGGSVTC